MGLNPIGRYLKHRTSYKLNKVKFEFDTYQGEHSYVPTFLEIESENENEIHKAAELLGFTEHDCRDWSFFEVEKFYKKD